MTNIQEQTFQKIFATYTDDQIVENILQKTQFSQIQLLLQWSQANTPLRWQNILSKIKYCVVTQPQPIYTAHDYLTVTILKLLRYIWKYEKSIENEYFQSQSGFVLISIAWGYLLQDLSSQKISKLKHFFAKNTKSSLSFWGLNKLQGLKDYLIDNSTGQPVTNSAINPQKYLDFYSFFIEFHQNFLYLFPTSIDTYSIMFKIMLCLRLERQRDKAIFNKITKIYQSNKYHFVTTIKNMKFSLEFYKYSFNEKQCLYYPQKVLQQILSKYSQSQVQTILTKSSIGMSWTQTQINNFFLNCIKLGFNTNSVKMMLAMISFCESESKYTQLLFAYQQNIKRLFIFIKHNTFFKSCMDILKKMIYSPIPTVSLFEKFKTEALLFLPKITPQHKYQFLNMLQVVAYMYQQILPIDDFKQVITSSIGNQINRLAVEQMQKIVQEYSWKENHNSINQNTSNNNKVQVVKSKYKGLTNIGNSCYMNSFLQALYMNRQFLRYVLQASTLALKQEMLKDPKFQGIQKQIIQKNIIQSLKPFAQLQKLFSLLMRSIRQEISPQLIRKIAPQMFRNCHQHDSIQFGRSFLDLIFKNKIPPLFQGEVTTQILCKLCNKSRFRKQAFLDYHVSSQGNHLQELIDCTFKQEIVGNLQCDFCQQRGQQSIKRHFISKFPNYLIISIKRFEYDAKEKRNIKNKAKINVPASIVIDDITYDLYSVVIHTGPSPNAGHYFTFSKSAPGQNCAWICHNDSQVNQFQSFQVVKDFLENSEEDTPYLLFFEKRQHVDSIKQLLLKPIQLRQPQQNFVKKDNQLYLDNKKAKKRQILPRINFNFSQFIKKDDEDDRDGYGGGGNMFNSYVL